MNKNLILNQLNLYHILHVVLIMQAKIMVREIQLIVKRKFWLLDK